MTTPKALRETVCACGRKAPCADPNGCKFPPLSLEKIARKPPTRVTPDELRQMQRALLDRLSGEAVTIGDIDTAARKLGVFKYNLDGWDQFPENVRDWLRANVKSMASLLPAGMDRNAVLEEAAKEADDYACGASDRVDGGLIAETIAGHIRALKS